MKAIVVGAVMVVAASIMPGGLAAVGAEFHVSPGGTADGDGSQTKPWDLATALGHPAAVQPGDTIWLHRGTYAGSFRSDLRGRDGASIIVRQAEGERAVIDLQPDPKLGAGLYCYGEWTRFQGFEVTCTNPRRRTEIAGSWPADVLRGSIEGRGSHLQFVNLLVHDLGSGFGFWAEGTGGEIHGCLIYNNGWSGPDRGHGHGIYAQNKDGIKQITDNVIFQQFGAGIHIYGSEKAFLESFRIEGNATFDNGCLHKPGEMTRGILVGGGAALKDIAVRENMIANGGLQIGYSPDAANEDVVARRNYVVGLSLYYQDRLVLEENTVIGGWPVLSVVQREGDSLKNYTVDNNLYYNTQPNHAPFVVTSGTKRSSFSFGEWRRQGFDTHSELREGQPSGAEVFVRPNKYERGRANVVVFNWNREPEVSVDLAGALERGQRFRIVGARNFHAPAVVSGTYEGEPVVLPMQRVTPVQPVGMPDYELPVLEPAFGAFVVLAE